MCKLLVSKIYGLLGGFIVGFVEIGRGVAGIPSGTIVWHIRGRLREDCLGDRLLTYAVGLK